ncbi:hypothetical protein CO180_02020, partial [candidate division WWE3 bacterium CG_4_9_14_3_um_filter_41_6]
GKRLDKFVTLTSTTGEIIPQGTYAPIRNDDFEGTVYKEKSLSITTKTRENAFIDLISSKISESSTSNLACIITIHDVTEERQLQEMQLDFVSMAAHELRTPLTSIRGYLEMLKENLWKKLTAEDKSFISRIEISTLQLNGLMENLLSASRIEKGIYALQKQPTNWLENVKQAVTNAKPLTQEKGLTILWKKPTSTIPLVSVDPLRINEVLNNLISNAVKYTPTGKITITIDYDKTNNEVVTHITDTGQGIPEIAMPHMFEKFFRVQGTLEQGSKGTGLGLYITRAIIELHGGKIWVTSQEAVGSTFSFSLPAAE